MQCSLYDLPMYNSIAYEVVVSGIGKKEGRWMMGERTLLPLVLVFNYLLVAAVTQTTNEDSAALEFLAFNWQNKPSNWVGSDPCDGWDGIKCNNSRITSISLPSRDITGQLSEHIGSLSELETLALSNNKGLTGSLPRALGNLKKLSNLFLDGCGFTGSIPDEIGSLQELVFLALNSNSFSGRIPPSIGKLSKLNWLDLTDNLLEGPIPVSSGTTPGLDMLHSTKHFHLGKNKLSGTIPARLFSSEMTLIHVLFYSNQLSGSVPSTLGLVQKLEVVRFDNNSLEGHVPPSINNLTYLQELYLSNNKLSGPLPSLDGMKTINYLDMSNNSFDATEFPPWLTTLQSLTTLKMEGTELQGQIPDSLFSLSTLKNVMLKDNGINGTLDIGNKHSQQLQLIDLQNNKIDNFKQQDTAGLHVIVILANNPICSETGATEKESYCKTTELNISDPATTNNCQPVACSSGQVSSPSCTCAYPYTGALTFRTPSFLDREKKDLEESLLNRLKSHNLPVDSVSLSLPTKDPVLHYSEFILQVFPSGRDHFNGTEILSISSVLSNLTNDPFYFSPDSYKHDEEPTGSSKSSNSGIIIGAAVGGSILFVSLLLAGVYAFYQKKKAERAIEQSHHPFGHGDPSDSNSSIPQLKGATRFSFEELQKYTNKFSQDNDIGSGGYGKVYRGTLPNGQLIAIKRAQKESMQGGLQFKAEIELLSRVHHKNLVSLLGFCFERGEQILVYEYVPNGTLKDAISGKSGIRLDWIRRLKVALGVARGLAYLHEHANPPIIHRDIKSSNVLLDERLNAKVADFGLSKPMVDSEKDHVTTQVKGTMGYLDPEYYTSQQLTEKSDVYSYGVLMLELITAKKPIERGKYIVKVVRNAIDKTKELYGLDEILDPTIGSAGSTPVGFNKFVELSMRCLEESGVDRPTMSAVVKEIENLLQSAVLNCSAELALAASPSSSYEEVRKWSSHHPYSNESFDSSGAFPHPSIEPK